MNNYIKIGAIKFSKQNLQCKTGKISKNEPCQIIRLKANHKVDIVTIQNEFLYNVPIFCLKNEQD